MITSTKCILKNRKTSKQKYQQSEPQDKWQNQSYTDKITQRSIHIHAYKKRKRKKKYKK